MIRPNIKWSTSWDRGNLLYCDHFRYIYLIKFLKFWVLCNLFAYIDCKFLLLVWLNAAEEFSIKYFFTYCWKLYGLNAIHLCSSVGCGYQQWQIDPWQLWQIPVNYGKMANTWEHRQPCTEVLLRGTIFLVTVRIQIIFSLVFWTWRVWLTYNGSALD